MMFTEEYEAYTHNYKKLQQENRILRDEIIRLKESYVLAGKKIKRQQEQLRKLNGHEVRN